MGQLIQWAGRRRSAAGESQKLRKSSVSKPTAKSVPPTVQDRTYTSPIWYAPSMTKATGVPSLTSSRRIAY